MSAALFRFHGGVKPASHKSESAREVIGRAPLPARLVVPLRQAVGTAAPLVKPGQRVLKGERIGAADDALSAAVHAPTSGTVIAIEPRTLPHPSGLPGSCVIIEPDGDERWIERETADYRALPRAELLGRLRDAGVVGLGGAVFPSHLKLPREDFRGCETLILNGVECEPWITCDDRLMRERAPEILRGASILRHILEAKRVLVGIEDDKPEALAAMQQAALAGAEPIQVAAIPRRYPAGGEKQLIRALTGIEIPYGKLGPHFGVQCFNVATAYSVHRALEHGEPVISRVLTLTGNVERPRNLEVLLGTPAMDLLPLAGVKPDTNRYIMGGPMMGFELPSANVPVVKATNCIIAASDRLFPPRGAATPCIRCGRCAEACPQELQPFELHWFARAARFDKCEDYHLFDCIECGCCAFVCPSGIRLVDYFRYAKSEMRMHAREKAAAQAARDRFEFRTERLEREKREKAEQLAARTAAARQAALAMLAKSAAAAAAADKQDETGTGEAPGG